MGKFTLYMGLSIAKLESQITKSRQKNYIFAESISVFFCFDAWSIMDKVIEKGSDVVYEWHGKSQPVI